jgi:hypothetical protein
MPAILKPDYTTAEYVRAVPICGEDFCDLCGDCLACYSGDPCPEGGHSWVVYAEDVEAFRASHAVT